MTGTSDLYMESDLINIGVDFARGIVLPVKTVVICFK